MENDMKIQDAISQNKGFWIEQEKTLTIRLANHQREVQKIAGELNEAQKQIELYAKAEELLKTLDQPQVDAVNVVIK
jgi:hypothetical protein